MNSEAAILSESTTPPAARGARLIHKLGSNLPDSPGCYRMVADDESVLYVGKAKNLKKRVLSYAKIEALSPRLQAVVLRTARMEIITTSTEIQALLVECDLIKALKPRYNIELRDDKSFASLLIRQDHAFPQIVKFRGKKPPKGRLFGPFASDRAVNQAKIAIQRAFLLRSCADGDFKTRSRPCLQYQIKRCSAPCVGKISPQAYGELAQQAVDFLSGKDSSARRHIEQTMTRAAEQLDFERAATLRDRLAAIALIQGQDQYNTEAMRSCDVVALGRARDRVAVQIFLFRQGRSCGSRVFFPRHRKEDSNSAILAAFLTQFYTRHEPPRLVAINAELDEHELIEQALSTHARRRLHIRVARRGLMRKLCREAERNAEQALSRRFAGGDLDAIFDRLANQLGLASLERIEAFDNAHIAGRFRVAAKVACDRHGFVRRDYRSYRVNAGRVSGRGGDDYAMTEEVLTRRFAPSKNTEHKNAKTSTDHLPELVIIDGGRGHLQRARHVIERLGVSTALLAAAKGPDRVSTEFYVCGRAAPLTMPTATRYFLNRLQDEAHRRATSFYRQLHGQSLTRSALDAIEGIGAQRKKALLTHFGSARAVSNAHIEQLARVPGISHAVAQRIRDHFNPPRH